MIERYQTNQLDSFEYTQTNGYLEGFIIMPKLIVQRNIEDVKEIGKTFHTLSSYIPVLKNPSIIYDSPD